MATKALQIFGSAKKLFLFVVIAGSLFVFTTSSVFAFHPGQDRNGTVPQGPNKIACDNKGRQGIDKAIDNGGEVHCETQGGGTI